METNINTNYGRRNRLGWQITLYISGAICLLMGIFLLVDYFTLQGVLGDYLLSGPESQDLKSTIGEMARHLVALRAVHMVFTLLATMGAIYLIIKITVLRPLNILFLHEYATGRGKLQPVPFPPMQNEFADLYEMFNRMVRQISQQQKETLADARRDVWKQAYQKLEKPLATIINLADALMAIKELEPGLTNRAASIKKETMFISEQLTVGLPEQMEPPE